MLLVKKLRERKERIACTFVDESPCLVNDISLKIIDANHGFNYIEQSVFCFPQTPMILIVLL